MKHSLTVFAKIYKSPALEAIMSDLPLFLKKRFQEGIYRILVFYTIPQNNGLDVEFLLGP